MRKSNYLKGFIVLGIVIGFFTSCEKDYYTKQREAESEQLNAYISANYPDLKPTSSGLYFITDTVEYIDEDTIRYSVGVGRQPETGDKVKFHYDGFYLNGYAIYGESTIGQKPKEIVLGKFDYYAGEISAWHEAIYSLKEGGNAKLVVPSSLGGRPNVSPYTPVIYRIELLEIISNAPEI